MLLNNKLVTEEIKLRIKNYLETNENGNTTFQSLWNAPKSVLRREIIALQAHLKRQ